GAAASRAFGERLEHACVHLRAAIDWLLAHGAEDPRGAHAGAAAYLELWGTVAGAWMHGLRLRAALGGGLEGEARQAAQASAQFYADHILIHAGGLKTAICEGAESVDGFPDTRWTE
ncbi:acyl-CoA dehydrogenase C-terminal domain-containing protein, partial [Achromobacter denitrificans]